MQDCIIVGGIRFASDVSKSWFAFMGLVRVGDVMAGIRMGKRKRKKGADVVRGFGGRLAPPILYGDLMYI